MNGCCSHRPCPNEGFCTPGKDFLKKSQNGLDNGRSLLLISDTSSICMDFALLYGRPVVSIDAEVANPDQYEMADVGDVWEREARREIGTVVKPDDLDTICGILASLLGRPTSGLAAFRDGNIANFGHSGTVIADWLVKKAESLAKE